MVKYPENFLKVLAPSPTGGVLSAFEKRKLHSKLSEIVKMSNEVTLELSLTDEFRTELERDLTQVLTQVQTLDLNRIKSLKHISELVANIQSDLDSRLTYAEVVAAEEERVKERARSAEIRNQKRPMESLKEAAKDETHTPSVDVPAGHKLADQDAGMHVITDISPENEKKEV